MGIVENKEHKLENSKEIPLNRNPPKTAGHIPTVWNFELDSMRYFSKQAATLGLEY